MMTAVAKRTATAAEREYAKYNLLTPAMVADRLQGAGAAGKDRITAGDDYPPLESGEFAPLARLARAGMWTVVV